MTSNYAVDSSHILYEEARNFLEDFRDLPVLPVDTTSGRLVESLASAFHSSSTLDPESSLRPLTPPLPYSVSLKIFFNIFHSYRTAVKAQSPKRCPPATPKKAWLAIPRETLFKALVELDLNSLWAAPAVFDHASKYR
jgi:hypothetical protein